MKLFIRLFLAAVLTVNAPAFCLAKGQTYTDFYHGVPVGETTTKIGKVLPYYKEITVSKQFVDGQKAADPVRHELNQIDLKLSQIRQNKIMRRYEAAPVDNTRVARPLIPLPKNILEKADGLDEALQQSRESQEEKEVQTLKKRRAELLKKLESSGVSRLPGDANFRKLKGQAEINKAYYLYGQSTKGSKYKQLPEFNKTPAQIQALITAELKSINSKLKEGPAYKSFEAIEKEVNKINNARRDDAILMSLFTLATFKARGAAVSAPSSALKWWSWPRIGYYFKKTVNFLGVISAYTLIDQANLNAVNISIEEMVTRFTALEDTMPFLQKLMKEGQTNAVGKTDENIPYNPWAGPLLNLTLYVYNKTHASIPSSWSKDPEDDTHRYVLRQLYGLRTINAYLQYSTVHYKYDLAMLDFFNLFSSLQEVPFDLSDFEHYHNGHKGAYVILTEEDEDGNEMLVRKWVNGESNPNKAYLDGDVSLLTKTDGEGNPTQIIKDLNKLPAFIYYKKTYYKDMANKDGVTPTNDPVIWKVPPQYIIRDKNGRLIDCGWGMGHTKTDRSGKVIGYNMNSAFDGAYYMRIEPVATVERTFYRDKPKTYVFEDINTYSNSCDDIVIMA